MAVLRSKGLIVIAIVTMISIISPVWSKALCSNILTDAGYLNLSHAYIKAVLFYSPLLILLDAVFSVVILIYLKRLIDNKADD